METEPLACKRVVQVRERRTNQDWAACMRKVLEGHYAQKEKVVLVMDNLNTHTRASFYAYF